MADLSLQSRTIPRHFHRALKLKSVLSRNVGIIRAVDPVEADAFSAGVVQDLDGVAVLNTDYSCGEIPGGGFRSI